jgi:DNA-binding transcriptional ArsR family regulator
MDTPSPSRQFIPIAFSDLDDPAWVGLLRSTATTTYLVLRRHVWRSPQEHPYGLHHYYARGDLACCLSRERLARAVGGVSTRQISRDIRLLLDRGLVRSVCTGRGNIYLLGHWHADPATGAYRERYYLDALGEAARPEPIEAERPPQEPEEPVDNLSPAPAPAAPAPVPSGPEHSWAPSRPACRAGCGPADGPDAAPSNREGIQNTNRGTGVSKSAGPSREEGDITEEDGDEEGEVLESGELECLIEACSRQFDDLEHLESNLTRAFNLWARTRLDEAGMLSATRRARERTLERISLSAVRDRTKRMAYFFALLEDVLGLRPPGGRTRTRADDPGGAGAAAPAGRSHAPPAVRADPAGPVEDAPLPTTRTRT